MRIINDIPLVDDGDSLQAGLNQASGSPVPKKDATLVSMAECQFQTPDASQSQNFDCQIVGNKFY
jgi:hypothetical protein